MKGLWPPGPSVVRRFLRQWPAWRLSVWRRRRAGARLAPCAVAEQTPLRGSTMRYSQ